MTIVGQKAANAVGLSTIAYQLRVAVMAYVDTGDENDLSAAYGIGRLALQNDMPLTMLNAVYFEAIRETSKSDVMMGRVDNFFLEATSVYDMVLKGYRENVATLQNEVSERRRIEEELRAATRDLERQRDKLDEKVQERTRALSESLDDTRELNRQFINTNRELEEFTYSLSHDLKAPTNTIRMMLGIVEEELGEAMTGDAQAALNGARVTATRMAQVVEDVLKFSHAIQGEQPFGRVDLNLVLKEIIADLECDIKAAKAEVEVRDMPEVTGNSTQMRLLLQNLIENAIKFHKRDCAPHIVVSGQSNRSSETATFSVSDNGIGIEEKHREKIFGLFQRLHVQEEFPGTGLGLALCKRIVSNHEGSISVTSDPGCGSAFHVSLWSNR